jgi:hypothetical protein
MKSLLAILAGLSACASWAQSPAALLDSNKIWSCYGDYFFQNVKYRLGSDTIIQGKVYKKVLAHGSEVPFNFDVAQSVYKSALREENGKVMVVESGFINEHILYDFNKQAGDTIRFYRPIGDFNQGVLPQYDVGKIYKTDQVTINGIIRRRWFIHDADMVNMIPPQAYSQLDSQADVWIEGLGAKTGLFSRMPEWGVVGPTPYLLTCVEQNGMQVYQNNIGYNADAGDHCFITPPGGSGSGGSGSGGGNDSLVLSLSGRTNDLLRTFPNPAQEQVSLYPVEGNFALVTLTDFRGNIVLSDRIAIFRQVLTVDLRSLLPGMYLLHLRNGEVNRNVRVVKR